jgi:adenylosuccinate synthase
MINGITELAMMKADVLSGMSDLCICTGYTVNGRTTDRMPYDITGPIDPVLETIEGWGDLDTGQALPKGLERYIAMIERHVGVPVTLVSLGPDRAQTVIRQAAMAR